MQSEVPPPPGAPAVKTPNQPHTGQSDATSINVEKVDWREWVIQTEIYGGTAGVQVIQEY